MDAQDKSNEEKYPSVNYAYEIGIKSYDWCIQRSDSIDGTIDRLLTWFSSITLGIVTLVARKGSMDDFHNSWFIATAIIFILIILAGIYTKVKGSLALVNPKEVYDKNLHRTEWDFKRTILFWSGRDFELNQGLVNWKGYVSVVMIIFFILEGVAIYNWLTSLTV